MKNVNYHSNFTRLIVKHGLLKESKMQVIDVGARAGPQSHWPIYGDAIDIIGFEPYQEESDLLNNMAKSGQFNVPFTCYPIALGSENSTARLYEYANKAANSITPPEGQHVEDVPYRDITVRRFDDWARENNLTNVDFMKIDVERHEVKVLQGLGKFLKADGILGFEVEVHFQPQGDAPLFSDIETLLRQHGYLLYDVDIFRGSNPLLPAPVAWDHRNHKNEPILGPTITGPMVHGDALFFKDLAPEKERILREKNVTRVLKMISLFEAYGLSDCAVGMLLEYRELIEPLLPMNTLLDSFVPDHYGTGLSYEQYLEQYQKHVGRAQNGKLVQARWHDTSFFNCIKWMLRKISGKPISQWF